MENKIEKFQRSMITDYEQEKARLFKLAQKNQNSAENSQIIINKLDEVKNTLKEHSNLMKENNNLLKELIKTLNKLVLDDYNEEPLPKIIHF